MKNIVLLTILSLFTLQFTFAIPFDTGWKTFRQPNSTTFTARECGDEFYVVSVTSDGHHFGRDRNTGWYYYTIQQINGEVTLTTHRVGIDAPSPLSKQFDTEKI
jgi:hypothetical protein